MSDRSENSLRLAEQLRTTALKNLGRSSEVHRSAITGKYFRPTEAREIPDGAENNDAAQDPRVMWRRFRRHKSM